MDEIISDFAIIDENIIVLTPINKCKQSFVIAITILFVSGLGPALII